MILKSAIFSPCRTWRYSLTREWDRKLGSVLWVGLNPSTATETEEDPTIRRCMRFAQSWGYGGIIMSNLFAFRATEPKDMMAAVDPVGPENDFWLRKLSIEAGVTVAAWGVKGVFRGRDKDVTDRLLCVADLMCLKHTKDGHPWHPLYVAGSARPVPLFQIKRRW